MAAENLADPVVLIDAWIGLSHRPKASPAGPYSDQPGDFEVDRLSVSVFAAGTDLGQIPPHISPVGTPGNEVIDEAAEEQEKQDGDDQHTEQFA